MMCNTCTAVSLLISPENMTIPAEQI